MVAQKRILVKPPFITWFFYESDCRICYYTLNKVLLPLETEGWIDIRLIDVEVNIGSPEVYWFNEYSEQTGGGTTPTIKIIDKYIRDGVIREDSVIILHLWEKEEKGAFVTEEDIKITERLREHILEAVNNYSRKCFNPFHDLKRPSSLFLPRRGCASSIGSG